MATIDVDRAHREFNHQRNQAESRVIEFGRTAHNPRRRQAPLNDSYDAITNWLVVLGGAAAVVTALVSLGVGFGHVVLWAERLVRS